MGAAAGGCCAEEDSGDRVEYVDDEGNVSTLVPTYNPRGEPTSFAIEIHKAILTRSFAMFGGMDPYAVVKADDAEEIARTEACKGGGKNPVWREQVWKTAHVPKTIEVEVWDKNNFHKDVFCGSVVIPIEKNRVEHQTFSLVKKDETTGAVTLSMKLGYSAVGPDFADDESSLSTISTDDDEAKARREQRNMSRLRKQKSRELDAETTAFTLDVHRAELNRSFATFGEMDPYAIVFAKVDNGDPLEIARTEPAVGGGKEPLWDHNVTLEDCPEFIEVEVYDKNTFHKDVFCGLAKIDIHGNMRNISEEGFDLEKHSKQTGKIFVSIKIGEDARVALRGPCC